MDDPALIGVHRLKHALFACLSRFDCQSATQGLESLFALFAIVAGIDDDSLISGIDAICRKTGQILQRVHGLASAADDKADVVAFDIDGDDVVLILGREGDTGQLHVIDDVADEILRCLSGALLQGDFYLSGMTAEKSEHLFALHLDDLKIYTVVVGLYAEFLTGFFLGFFNRSACCDYFS